MEKENRGIVEEEEEENTMAEVSLNSVIGLSNPNMMILKGEIARQKVVVLIDSRATNNFISLSTVDRQKIPITGQGKFGVILGNGEKV